MPTDPVSYTHLDGYKRQGMGHTVGESLTQKFAFIRAEKVFFTEAFRSDDRNSVKEHDFELDVYKRQL